VRIRSGHAPTGANQVVIDASSADHHHIALGSDIHRCRHGDVRRREEPRRLDDRLLRRRHGAARTGHRGGIRPDRRCCRSRPEPGHAGLPARRIAARGGGGLDR
jgi:hypothetical protein